MIVAIVIFLTIVVIYAIIGLAVNSALSEKPEYEDFTGGLTALWPFFFAALAALWIWKWFVRLTVVPVNALSSFIRRFILTE